MKTGSLIIGAGLLGGLFLLSRSASASSSPNPKPPKGGGGGGGTKPAGGGGDLQSLGCELDDDLPQDQKVYILGQLALWNAGNVSDMDPLQNLLLAAASAEGDGHPKAAACLRMLAEKASGGTYV
jgi:hypothetical protein